jgi:hypothetical protein
MKPIPDTPESPSDHEPGAPGHPQEGAEVTITVNGSTYKIHRGHQTVTAIKQVALVPLAHDLEQVVGNALTPLPDDGSVTLKGGEVFVSHPKDAGSS